MYLNVCEHHLRRPPDQLTVFSISGRSSNLCFLAFGVMGIHGTVEVAVKLPLRACGIAEVPHEIVKT